MANVVVHVQDPNGQFRAAESTDDLKDRAGNNLVKPGDIDASTGSENQTLVVQSGGDAAFAFLAQETFLDGPTFQNPTGDVTTSFEDVDPTTDFLQLAKIESADASGRLDAVYRGMLGSGQLKIDSIKVWVKSGASGTPEMDIQVYVEGQAGSNQYTGAYASKSSVPGGGSASLITIPNTEISNQPSSNKRYFVFVRAYLDDGESMFISAPFVRQV